MNQGYTRKDSKEMGEWIHYKEVDFADPLALAFHIDTRDFHCNIARKDEYGVDIHKLRKYPDRFFYTAEDVKALLDRLFEESSGDAEWRLLELETYNANWGLKYLRIYRKLSNGFAIMKFAYQK